MITGVYAIRVHHFADTFHYELHIKEDGPRVLAQIKYKNRVCSFFNGSTVTSPAESETHQFLFRSGQVEDYVDVLLPSGERVNLSPPGGYHVAGMLFGGTVVDDEVTATITLKDMLVISIHGTRTDGEPEIQMQPRTDCFSGKNPYCTCGTGTCTHRGYCDCCQIFEFMHSAGMPDMDSPAPVVPLCMGAHVNSLFGISKEDMMKAMAIPAEPDANGEKRPAHGKHHLVDPDYIYKID